MKSIIRVVQALQTSHRNIRSPTSLSNSTMYQGPHQRGTFSSNTAKLNPGGTILLENINLVIHKYRAEKRRLSFLEMHIITWTNGCKGNQVVIRCTPTALNYVK
ncbi:hypothetical protein M758_UG319700 [Ceratodon purpureus]|nr:hypothetical protein M758_UG319700 [Ceratodon purpureus]